MESVWHVKVTPFAKAAMRDREDVTEQGELYFCATVIVTCM